MTGRLPFLAIVACLLAGCAIAPNQSDPTTSPSGPFAAAQTVDEATLAWSYGGDGGDLVAYTALVRVEAATTLAWRCLPVENVCYLPDVALLLPASDTPSGCSAWAPRVAEDSRDTLAGPVAPGVYHLVVLSAAEAGGFEAAFGAGGRVLVPAADPTLAVQAARASRGMLESGAVLESRATHAAAGAWWALAKAEWFPSEGAGVGAPEAGGVAVEAVVNDPCTKATQAAGPAQDERIVASASAQGRGGDVEAVGRYRRGADAPSTGAAFTFAAVLAETVPPTSS